MRNRGVTLQEGGVWPEAPAGALGHSQPVSVSQTLSHAPHKVLVPHHFLHAVGQGHGHSQGQALRNGDHNDGCRAQHTRRTHGAHTTRLSGTHSSDLCTCAHS
jgi:hypothetical protein